MTSPIASSLPVVLRRPSLVSLFVAFALVACGGGNGSDSSNPQPEPQPPTPPPVLSKGNISLLTGSTAGVGNLDGTGSTARFNRPSGVALDSTGNLYVADARGHRIRKVTPAGVVTTVAGSGLAGYDDGASGVATFCAPFDVAVDGNDNVFVLDYVVVRKVSADGNVTTVTNGTPPNCEATQNGAAPRHPSAVAVDQAGVLYIADQLAVQVYRLAPTGELTQLAGIDQPTADGIGAFGQLLDLAVDNAGNLYVGGTIGYGPGAVRKVTPAGVITTVVAPVAGSPAGTLAFTVDRNGALFYTDTQNNTISTVLPSGAVQQVVGGIAQAAAIAADADGGFWFTGYGTNTIRRIDSTGRVIDVAGQLEPSEPNFSGNLAADSAGNVYVLAQRPPAGSSLVLQRVAPDGSTTTLLDRLESPQGMAVDAEDSVYLASRVQIGTTCGYRGMCGLSVYGSEVTKLDTQGRVTKLPRVYRDASGNEIGLDRVTALAGDRAGNLYVADSRREDTAIYRITLAGAISTVAVGQFRVSDLAADSQGNVYAPTCGFVNYATGAQIVRYGADGTTTPLAGTFDVVSGAADGVGDQARFGSCQLGIALDRNDHIFVADTRNHTVRRVSAGGEVSTVVGRAGQQGITLGAVPASLSAPLDLSFDGAGNLYVSSAHAILKVRPGD